MTLYEEVHRPRFHFTARENWHNDPNGLVYYEGRWHLFFQHNPESTLWGNMTWGHAVSEDLVHWRQLDHALYPDELGTMFSGSAVVDWEGTAGFGKQALLVFYTAAGQHVDPDQPYTQCLAVSTDGGDSWEKCDRNPIVGWFEAHNRDPKVIWHAPTGRWIMILYLADDRYCLLRSQDAKTWERFQDLTLAGDSECPDFFPLSDDDGNERWVFWGASGTYVVGEFDGDAFAASTDVQQCEQGSNGYAAQTYSDTPDGRRIQISWMAGGQYPEMPFNQQMSFPVELKLRGSGAGVRLTRWPIEEIHSLRRHTCAVASTHVADGERWAPACAGTLFDVSFELTAGSAAAMDLVVRGQPLVFDFSESVVRFRNKEVPLPEGPSVAIRLLIDRASVELFVDGGATSASFCFLPAAHDHPLVFAARGGETTLDQVEIHELQGIWAV